MMRFTLFSTYDPQIALSRSIKRDCESIYVGEALASNSRLKPLLHYIKTMTYKIKKVVFVLFL